MLRNRQVLNVSQRSPCTSPFQTAKEQVSPTPRRPAGSTPAESLAVGIARPPRVELKSMTLQCNEPIPHPWKAIGKGKLSVAETPDAARCTAALFLSITSDDDCSRRTGMSMMLATTSRSISARRAMRGWLNTAGLTRNGQRAPSGAIFPARYTMRETFLPLSDAADCVTELRA